MVPNFKNKFSNIIIISLIILFLLFILFIIIMPNPTGEPDEYHFVSPSRNFHLLFREGCLGIACYHQVYIDSGIIPLINKKSCSSYSADGLIFSDIEVKWSIDENIIWWKNKRFSQNYNKIDINNDCKNEFMSIIKWIFNLKFLH